MMHSCFVLYSLSEQVHEFFILFDVVRRIISGYKKTPQDEEVGSGTGYSSSKQDGKAEDTGTKLSEVNLLLLTSYSSLLNANHCFYKSKLEI